MSKAYDAKTVFIDGEECLYRKSRITPKKLGEFVALWKQEPRGPYSEEDSISYFIIESETKEFHFKFPKDVLVSRGIIASSNSPGKQGFRLYPPHCVVSSKQALETQAWQSDSYVDAPFIL